MNRPVPIVPPRPIITACALVRLLCKPRSRPMIAVLFVLSFSGDGVSKGKEIPLLAATCRRERSGDCGVLGFRRLHPCQDFKRITLGVVKDKSVDRAPVVQFRDLLVLINRNSQGFHARMPSING